MALEHHASHAQLDQSLALCEAGSEICSTKQVIRLINKVAESASTLKEDLDKLKLEVESLQSTGEKIKDLASASGRISKDSLSKEDLIEIQRHWAAVHNVLDDCRKAVDELEAVAEKIFGKTNWNDSGKFELAKLLGRKIKNEARLDELRQQIQRNHHLLTTMLSVLSPFYQMTTHADLKNHINDVGKELQKQIQALKDPSSPLDAQRIEDLVIKALNRRSTVTKIYLLPKALSPTFTGRERELKDLMQDFDLPSSINVKSNEPRRFVIEGMGGSGKTEFAVKFAEENQALFNYILTVDASSHETITASYGRIAKSAGGSVEYDVEGALHWLTNLQEPWLLIVDNAELIAETLEGTRTKSPLPVRGSKYHGKQLRDYLPSGNYGYVIITTRNKQHCHYGNAGRKFCTFERLDKQKAEELLLRAAGIEIGAQLSEVKRVKIEKWAPVIAKKLAYLPLALEHAGRAILDFKCDWDTYIDDVYNRIYEDISKHHEGKKEDQNFNVFATFEIIYRQLEDSVQSTEAVYQDGGNAYSDAVDLLNIFACLHNNNVYREMLLYAAMSGSKSTSTASESRKKAETAQIVRPWSFYRVKSCMRQYVVDIITWYSSFIGPRPVLPSVLRANMITKDTRKRISDALGVLVRKSILRQNEETDSFFIHPLVHEWLRMRERSLATQALWCEWAAEVVASCLDVDELASTHRQVDSALNPRSLMPHVDHIQTVQAEIRAEIEKKIELAYQGKNLVWAPHRKLLAVPSIPSVHPLRWAKFSLVYSHCGQFLKANDLSQKLYEYVTARLGKENETAIKVTMLYATSSGELTEFKLAGDLFEEVASACETLYGSDATQTLVAKDRLAFIRTLQGRFAEALELSETACNGLETLQGERREQNFDAIMEAKCHLAVINSRYERFGTASRLLEDAVEQLERQRPQSPATLNAMQDLAEVYTLCGKQGPSLDRARKLMLHVLDARRRTGGDENPYTLLARKNLADVYLAAGEYEDGEKIMRPTVEAAKKALGDDHFGIPMGKVVLARLVMAQGRHEEALEILRETRESMTAIAKRQRRDPDELNPDHVVVLSRTIECLEELNRLEEALQTAYVLWDSIGKVGAKGNGYSHPAAKRCYAKVRKLEKRLSRQQRALSTNMEKDIDFTSDGEDKSATGKAVIYA